MRKGMKVAVFVGAMSATLVLGGIYFATRLNVDPNALAVGTVAPVTSFVSAEGSALPLDPAAGLPTLVFYRGHW